MNVSLGKAWDQYVADQVASGQFNDAGEVLRDALRRQREQLGRLDALRREARIGVASVEAGRISRSGPDDIIGKARARNGSA